MSFQRNHQIVALAKKATDYALAQLVDYLKLRDSLTKDGEKRESENEALQVLFYIFCKKNNISPKFPPQDKAIFTLAIYVTEIVNMEIPVWGDRENVELITETVLSHLKNGAFDR